MRAAGACAVLMALGLSSAACGGDGGGMDGASGGSAAKRYGCTDKQLFKDLTVDEARCMCRRSVELAEELFVMCLGEDGYAQTRASCEAEAFRGYTASCSVEIDDWVTCRNVLDEATTCDELEQLESRFELEDYMGCGTLFVQVNDCVDTSAVD